MIRLGRVNLAVLLLLLLPMAAEAQRDSRYTREATKFMGLAMTRQDPAQRADLYQQAMAQLRQGMEQDASNAKVWLLAGQVLAALGEMNEADQAFTRAVEMHPEYAEEVAGEREAAWMEAFNEGVTFMGQQAYPEAIAKLEAAQVIYKLRPEALMNLGALYANAGDNAKAAQAFREAAEATRGSVFEQLDEETQASWLRYRDMATVNLAQLAAAEGVQAFEARNYEAAAAAFKQAWEQNPHSRDYIYNYVQSLWAHAGELEDVVEEKGAGAAAARAQLLQLYPQIEEIAAQTRQRDPNNELLYLIHARAVRMRGEMSGDKAAADAGHQGALRLLQEHEALPVSLDEVVIIPEGEAASVAGVLKNRKQAAGTPVQVEFTLLGIDGQVLGQQVITVEAPAADETARFEASIPLTGELAGWRYVVKS
jgi:tetratricopeptide (TPR) repeat protein